MLGWRVVVVGVGAALVAVVLAPVAGAASTGGATDKEIATAAVLVASDLPATYAQSARDTSSDAQTLKLVVKVAACKKLVAFTTATNKSPEVKSDDFRQGQTQIDNTVSVFSSAAKAKAAVDAYAATGMPGCLGQVVGKIAQQAGGKAQSSIKKVQITAGDQAIAYEGPVQITESDGSTSAIAFGTLVIRVGRGVAVYSYNHDPQVDISSDLRNAVSSSGQRLQSALAR
jgi:hypothetical protein